MSHKDDELNELLKPIQDLSPDDLQMQKWHSAVQREVRKGQMTITTTRGKLAFQLVAAMFVGVVMGAILIKTFSPTNVQDPQNPMVAKFSINNATFEHSHANLD